MKRDILGSIGTQMSHSWSLWSFCFIYLYVDINVIKMCKKNKSVVKLHGKHWDPNQLASSEKGFYIHFL